MIDADVTKYIPKVLQDNIDAYGQALINKLNSYISTWKIETIALQDLLNVDKCPSQFLDLLGYAFNADTKNFDSDRTKRIKIYNAVQGLKNRSLWELDLKIGLDSITGLNSNMISSIDNSQWLLIDGSAVFFPPAYYWASMGCDGIDNNTGLDLIGDGTEISVAGNIYIDLGGNVSAGVLNQIENDIMDIIPAYYKIYLGYLNAGIFNLLATI